jgi:hypothetical protein
MEDHTKTMKITTEGPEFEMPSHYMKKLLHPSRPKDKASL